MSMLQHSTRAWGSPSRYIQGRFELDNIKTHTEVYGRKVFFLIDVFFYADFKKKFEALYAGSDSTIRICSALKDSRDRTWPRPSTSG